MHKLYPFTTVYLSSCGNFSRYGYRPLDELPKNLFLFEDNYSTLCKQQFPFSPRIILNRTVRIFEDHLKRSEYTL